MSSNHIRTSMVDAIRKVFAKPMPKPKAPKGPGVAKAKKRLSLTSLVLAALDSERAQTTAEIARKCGTTVAIASATLNSLRKQGLVVKRAPWILAPLAIRSPRRHEVRRAMRRTTRKARAA